MYDHGIPHALKNADQFGKWQNNNNKTDKIISYSKGASLLCVDWGRRVVTKLQDILEDNF